MQRARPCATGAWHSRCLVDLLRRVLGESVPARREGARAERGMAQDERAARERDARNCGPAAAPVDRERAHEAGGRQPFPQADRLVEQRERFRVAPAARRRKDLRACVRRGGSGAAAGVCWVVSRPSAVTGRAVRVCASGRHRTAPTNTATTKRKGWTRSASRATAAQMIQ
eukprot:2975794-Prymnesium_polylepis.1